MSYIENKNQSTGKDPQMIQVTELIEKDIRAVIIPIFNRVKKEEILSVLSRSIEENI